MKPASLSDLADKYDVFLVDQFGVLIDGAGAYDGAIEAMHVLLEAGKTVIVLTNSGKRAAHTRTRLEGYGFSMPGAQVVSSGEVARTLLATRFSGHAAPCAVWYEAENTDASPLEGLQVRYVDDMQDADLVMIAGVRSEDATLGAFKARFRQAIERGVPCICTNPDQRRLTSKGVRFAAGRIAALYQEMGGKVEWVGKPYRAMYDHATDLVGPAAKVICLGDSFAHDIKGAAFAGLPSVLVKTGLARDVSDEDLMLLCEQHGASPDYLLASFRYT
ncbi:MAG: TIGR01459 family HAD-type hydrolase [Litoreibacter sp.]|nr:TIGR01459 family HAD-type hydrolase [Litoreibacter sp.]